jgi:hypothetical protein
VEGRVLSLAIFDPNAWIAVIARPMPGSDATIMIGPPLPPRVGKAPEAQNRGGKLLKSRRKSARSRRISRRSARMSTRSARMSARYPCLSIEFITKILVRH